MSKLTMLTIKHAVGPAKLYDEYGLILNVSKNGSKYWSQKVTIKRGKRIELGVGNLQFVSLSDARKIAFGNICLAKEGIDPRKQTKDQNGLTFAQATPKVYEQYKGNWKNPKDQASFITTIKKYAFPIIGQKQLYKITVADVRSIYIGTLAHAPTVAPKVLQRIRLVFKWAMAEGYCDSNPASSERLALPKSKHKPKHHKSLPYQKVPDFVSNIKKSHASASTKLALEMLIHTALRSNEVRKARWTEIIWGERAVWTIPAERMKMGKDHKVPLTTQCIDILKDAKKYSNDCELIFPGMKKGSPLSDMTLSKLIKQRGFDVTVHGFRTTFRTWAQEQTTCEYDVAEAVLAHSSRSVVEKAYARSDLFEKRFTLMQEWSNYVSKQPSGGHKLF